MNYYPKSIIQIHYHSRSGGVTTVMRSYAKLFSSEFGVFRNNNVVISSGLESVIENDKYLKPIFIEDIAYNSFNSLEEFIELRDKIIKSIICVINDLLLFGSVYVIGHNLTLCKNIALSSAFTQIAKKIHTNKNIKFYSVIHDLVEQGRFDLQKQLFKSEKFIKDLKKDIYPSNKYVNYLCPGELTYKLLKDCKFNIRFLPNAVESNAVDNILDKNKRKIIENTINKIANIDGVGSLENIKVRFYPARIIPRKNICEAILTFVILDKGGLLIGGTGSDKYDVKFFSRIKELSSIYKLPIILDINRIIKYLPQGFVKDSELFKLMQMYSDECVTTSVAEGFGYALYEPWLNGKSVIGRLPQGIKQYSYLYDKFEIPKDWIDINILNKKYRRLYNIDLLNSGLINYKHDYIDFALLDQDCQLEIIENILSKHRGYELSKIGKSYNRLKKQILMYDSYRIKNEIIETIKSKFGEETVRKEFIKVFTSDNIINCGRGNYKNIATHFKKLSNISLLLSR